MVITPSQRLAGSLLPPYRVWKKGERSAYDFHLRGYRGAWLLADGSMVTDESHDETMHFDFYKKYKRELRKAQGIRIQSPNVIQIYFPPVTNAQKEEIARLYQECEQMCSGDMPPCLWWDLSSVGKEPDWYDAALAVCGEGSFGDFLRALEKYEREFGNTKTVRS